MKQKIRDFFFFFAAKLIPELYYLKSKINGSATNSKIHPKAKLFPPFSIRNCIIDEGTYIANNAVISLTNIGKYCSIGPNFNCGWGIHPTNGISTSPIFYSTKEQCGYTFSKEDKIEEKKLITIGNDVFIGMNVTVLDGVNIGDGAIIGAGAVVSKDIPPYAIAVGSPIQIKKYRFDENTIDKLLKIRWWDFERENLQDVEKYFFDIDTFIKKYYHVQK